jgi:hypothetical protein
MMDSTLPRIAAKRRRRRNGPEGVSGSRTASLGGRWWRKLAVPVGVAVALAALVSLSALAASGGQRAERVAVVMDGSVAHDPARRAAADEWLKAHGAAGVVPRVAEGPTQQLSVTSTLANRGYDVIVAVALDGPIALDPVARHYPQLRVIRG